MRSIRSSTNTSPAPQTSISTKFIYNPMFLCPSNPSSTFPKHTRKSFPLVKKNPKLACTQKKFWLKRIARNSSSLIFSVSLRVSSTVKISPSIFPGRTTRIVLSWPKSKTTWRKESLNLCWKKLRMTLKAIIDGMNNFIFSLRKEASTLISKRMSLCWIGTNATWLMDLWVLRITYPKRSQPKTEYSIYFRLTKEQPRIRPTYTLSQRQECPF